MLTFDLETFGHWGGTVRRPATTESICGNLCNLWINS
jgi:hypothetical protein